MGWRDHILVAGHHHTAAHAMERDPMTGLISHCVRVGSYKRHDSFADERFFANKNMFASCLFVIDPTLPDDHPGRTTFFADLEAGADFLTWKRRKDAA
jgi:hypothetical protein